MRLLNLILIVLGYFNVLIHEATSAKSAASSIAEQLGFGIKRATYYMDSLLESCDNIDDLNQWILFMDSYLKCDAEAHPKKRLMLTGEDSLERLNALCDAWPKRRKCSSRLATKLNSCLGSQLEDGRTGANALHLSDAHMKFMCRHKQEYAAHLDFNGEVDEKLLIEKRSLACFREMKTPLNACITEGTLQVSQTTFCGKFNLAKECLVRTSMETCKNHAARNFLHKMLEQLQTDVHCSSANELHNS